MWLKRLSTFLCNQPIMFIFLKIEQSFDKDKIKKPEKEWAILFIYSTGLNKRTTSFILSIGINQGNALPWVSGALKGKTDMSPQGVSYHVGKTYLWYVYVYKYCYVKRDRYYQKEVDKVIWSLYVLSFIYSDKNSVLPLPRHCGRCWRNSLHSSRAYK